MKKTIKVLVISILLFVPTMAQAQDSCKLGAGYLASGSKATITFVAHQREFGGDENLAAVEDMKLNNKYFITAGKSSVEIMKRSGVLVQVRCQGKADIFWTIESAVSCY